MYFKGKLSIAPSAAPKIQKMPPGPGLKRILYDVAGGVYGEKVEVEKFSALGILEQLHGILKSTGAKNIIKLKHDDIVIYHDREGNQKDIDFAIAKYQIEIDDSMSQHFESLMIIVEHEDEQFKYLFDIKVWKTHKEHAYPIEITVNAFLKEFRLSHGVSKDQLKKRMATLFQNQEEYDQYIHSKKLVFEQFLESMRFEIFKHIPTEDIRLHIKPVLVLQSKRKHEMPPEHQPKDVPYEYFGFGDLILYSWLWSELMFDHHIHVSNADIINTDGDLISSIGPSGIDAGDTSLMDYSVDYDDRIENLSSSDIGSFGTEELTDAESSKSWIEDLFGDGKDFDLDFS